MGIKHGRLCVKTAGRSLPELFSLRIANNERIISTKASSDRCGNRNQVDAFACQISPVNATAPVTIFFIILAAVKNLSRSSWPGIYILQGQQQYSTEWPHRGS